MNERSKDMFDPARTVWLAIQYLQHCCTSDSEYESKYKTEAMRLWGECGDDTKLRLEKEYSLTLGSITKW